MISTIHSRTQDALSEFEIHKLLNDAQTADANGTSDEVDVSNAKSLCLYVHGNSSAVSGGTVVLEGSPLSAHSGTWKSLGSVTVLPGQAMAAVSVTDGDDGFPVRYVRARITTQISNGNIDAYLVVQK